MQRVFLGASLCWTLIASAQEGARFSDPLRSGGHGPSMVTIAPGEFQMGCVSGLLCDDNLPVHTVKLERSFALSVYEITRGQFRAFVERTGYRPVTDRPGALADYSLSTLWGCGGFALSEFRALYPGPELTLRKFTWRDPGHPQTDDHPVVCVTRGDVMAYVEWLASETGRPYRLPSEGPSGSMRRGRAVWGRISIPPTIVKSHARIPYPTTVMENRIRSRSGRMGRMCSVCTTWGATRPSGWKTVGTRPFGALPGTARRGWLAGATDESSVALAATASATWLWKRVVGPGSIAKRTTCRAFG